MDGTLQIVHDLVGEDSKTIKDPAPFQAAKIYNLTKYPTA